MIVRAFIVAVAIYTSLRAYFSKLFVRARCSFVVKWMELFLLPSMTASTSPLPSAAFLVSHYKCSTFPILAHAVIIQKQIWFASKILPVMRIYTLSLVVLMSKWTPSRFKIK